MAAALMQCRDAIVGTEAVEPVQGQDVTLAVGQRLMRMGPVFRRHALVAELAEDIGFEDVAGSPAGQTAAAVRVLRRKAGTSATSVEYLPLAELVRPAIGQLQEAVPMVATYAELRADRAAEIMVQTGAFVPFFASVLPVTFDRCPAVAEMLDCALDIVDLVVMRAKITLGCPRPSQFSDRIQPMIPEPPHPAYPSGHATQVFTLATMLTLLDRPDATVAGGSQLYRLACRIAINRTVAGMHYPVDSAAGAILGIQLGRYLMARGLETPGSTGTARFDGTRFGSTGRPRDFHCGVLDELMGDGDPATDFSGDPAPVRAAPLWQTLCHRGAGEWSTRWS